MVIDELQEALDQAQASSAEADSRVSDLCIRRDEAFEQIKVGEAELEAARAAQTAAEARKASIDADTDAALAGATHRASNTTRENGSVTSVNHSMDV